MEWFQIKQSRVILKYQNDISIRVISHTAYAMKIRTGFSIKKLSVKWPTWTFHWLLCVSLCLLCMLWRHTQMYTQPLSLPPTDKLASKGTNRRDFWMPICSAALNQPRGIFPEPPGLSKGLLLPNYHCEVQSRQPGASNQEPEIISTNISSFVTSQILALCAVRAKEGKRGGCY